MRDLLNTPAWRLLLAWHDCLPHIGLAANRRGPIATARAIRGKLLHLLQPSNCSANFEMKCTDVDCAGGIHGIKRKFKHLFLTKRLVNVPIQHRQPFTKCLNGLLCCIGLTLAANYSLGADTSSLQNRYQTLAVTALTQGVQQNRWLLNPSPDSLPALHQQVIAAAKTSPVTAIGSTLNHLNLVASNVKSEKSLALINLLLRYNLATPVQTLLTTAIEKNDFLAAHQLQLTLAHYYLDNQEWQAAAEIALPPNFSAGLSGDDLADSLITRGLVLQKQKKHRAALAEYAKVDLKSRLYSWAKFNSATANIRQDWWTEAQQDLNTALAVKAAKNNELHNHILLTLGYLNIKKGFYRDAQTQFRKVELTSRYAPRAMLGLGLAALEQRQYEEAGKVFNYLKAQPDAAETRAEAYLLIGVSQQHKGDAPASIANYQQAISYFEEQILLASQIKMAALQQQTGGDQHIPMSASENQWQARARIIAGLLEASPDNNPLKILLADIHAYQHQLRLETIQGNIDNLNLYLSNSRYGLANVYDTRNSPRP